MTAPTAEQRAAWRAISDWDADHQPCSSRILALLDALDAAEQERDWLRDQAAQGVALRNRLREAIEEAKGTVAGRLALADVLRAALADPTH